MTQSWRRTAVFAAAATALWVLVAFGVGWGWLAISMSGWSDGGDPVVGPRDGRYATILLAAVVVAGPVLVAFATVCYARRARTTMGVLLLVATVACCGFGGVWAVDRSVPEADPAPRPPGRCQEHSGGVATCPGG